MQDKLADAIRVGIISSIDPTKGTAQVTFEDREDMVSGELSVIMPVTGSNQIYMMPAVNERVLCVFIPDSPSDGFILGSYYSEGRLPPVSSAEKVHMRFKDGSYVEYDNSSSTLTVKASGNVIINAAQGVSVISEGNVSISAPHVSIN
ncbi:MAG: phage baseplate assembly protein V [Oscillospiraceae bacterium]|nr:phage baseplate assembly protein V [Oscillospiraceae bacterium]